MQIASSPEPEGALEGAADGGWRPAGPRRTRRSARLHLRRGRTEVHALEATTTWAAPAEEP
jgi:hypothetical protein